MAGEDPELIGVLASRIGWGWAMQDARERVKTDRYGDNNNNQSFNNNRSPRCWLVSTVSCNLSCFCVSQHLESLCSFLTCLRPSVSIFLPLFCSTLRQHFDSKKVRTFFVPILVILLLLMFHSPELLSISTLSLTIRFLSISSLIVIASGLSVFQYLTLACMQYR